MDSTKAQDITRHIFKDEDKGCEYIKNNGRNRFK